MIGLLLPAVLAVSPQIVPSNTEALIVGGAADRRLDLADLALGDGGVRAVRVVERPRGSQHEREPDARGRACTPGGVLVRAQTEGVKFDFPSGRELMATPDGRLHLRSGEMTLPFLRGVRILLADGAAVTILRVGPSRPLASVDVDIEGRVERLWTGTHAVSGGSHTSAFAGETLVALGDGGRLYCASAAGPLLALERVLCPRVETDACPARRLVIAGGVLAESLGLLPAHAPRRSVQFPQVEEAAMKFAQLGYLFSRRVPRPPGAVGELWFPLEDGYRLKVETDSAGVLVIGLYREGSEVPGVEWTVSGHSQIHFVRPDGGENGGPRYFMRGIDLAKLVQDRLPIDAVASHRSRIQRVIGALGGRTPHALEVRRR